MPVGGIGYFRIDGFMSGYKHPDCAYHKCHLPRPRNYPLIYPKYPLLRAIRAPLKRPWGVLVGALENGALSTTSGESMLKALRVGFLTGLTYLTSMSRMTRDHNSYDHVEA